MGLGENHRRALASTLSHVDRLLLRIEADCSGLGGPFSRIAADLSPAERGFVQAQVTVARARMVRAMSDLGIPMPARDVAASWSVRTALACARIALEDAAPARLRGYGALDAESARSLEGLEADIERTLERLETWVARGAARDLGARLEKLGAVPLDMGLLCLLHEITAKNGLVEFQGALESIVEHLEAGTREVAFFGRVSCGKSSLMNAILGAPVLPVGVTPVTAIPTRIEAGDAPGATIRFASGEEIEIPLDRLADYVTEAANPGNAKNVERAMVRMSSPLLPRGLVLVDTPGVGALAAAGARLSAHYLPRCDDGVVLIDASGSLAEEDVDLVQQLTISGIRAHVLLSKADLLSEADRRVFREYIGGKLKEMLSMEPPVHAVSVEGPLASLALGWFESEFLATVEHGGAPIAMSAARKLEAAREGVIAALRSGGAGESPTGQAVSGETGSATGVEADAAAREAESILAEAARAFEHITDDARGLGERTIRRAAALSSERWGEPSFSLPKVVSECLASEAREVRGAVLAEARNVRGRLQLLLEPLAASQTLTGTPLEPPAMDTMSLPELVVPECLSELRATLPAWRAWSRRSIASSLETTIREQAGKALDDAGPRFASAIRDWASRSLRRLAASVALVVEPLRAAGRPTTDAAAARESLARLLEYPVAMKDDGGRP